jgi:hypothetical protein
MSFEGEPFDDGIERDGEMYDGQADESDIDSAGHDGVTADDPAEGSHDIDDDLPDAPDDPPRNSDVGEGERQGPPIDTLNDALVNSYLPLDRPDNAYYVAHNQVHDALRQAVHTGELTPALRSEVTNYLALSSVLGGRIFEPAKNAVDIIETANVVNTYGERLGIDAEEVMGEADQIPPDQAVGYLLGKLESHTEYLRNGGDRPENWPETESADSRLYAPGFASQVTHTAELAARSLDLLGGTLGENESALRARLQDWVSDTGSMLLEHRQVGRAAALLNLADAEHQRPLMDNLVDAMGQVREAEGTDAYRQCYSFTAHTLDQGLRDQFAQRAERIGAPAIPGARQELLIDNDGSFIMVDSYETERPVTDVELAGGGTIDLPFAMPVNRILRNYGETNETEEVRVARGVSFNDLDETAVAAIDRATEAAGDEPMPHYRRLALRTDQEGHASLHTMVFDDGMPRPLTMYPETDAAKPAGMDTNLHAAVASAEHVSDGYLVVRADCSVHPPYTDAEPNLFGPGADRANAFWIAGEPRQVWHDLSDPRYMQWSEDGRDIVPRWVVMPVQFYRVEEPSRQTDETRPPSA